MSTQEANMSEAVADQSVNQERFGEVISSLRRRLAKLEEDVAAAERERDELRDRVETYEQHVEIQAESADAAGLEDIWVAGIPVGTIISNADGRSKQNARELDGGVTEEQLRDEQKERTQQDAKLRQRIKKVADKADVTITDTDIMGDDRIQTVIDDGPEAIVDGRLSPVHERAADLLLKIDEWGTRVSDANGRRFVIKTGEAKSRLNDYRGESLQSVEIGRVFDKVQSWAAESPRDVTVDKAPDGQRRITITVEAA